MTKHLISFLTVLILSLSAMAQAPEDNKEEKSLDSGSIENQFDYLIEESNRYEQYKVVKIEWLNKLKLHVSDSLKAVRKELKETGEVVSTQRDKINGLKEDLESTKKGLGMVTNEKDNIIFLGTQMTKRTYKNIMWSLVIGLFALMLFFIFKFSRSNVITTEARNLLLTTQEEFEAFKKSAREREQRIKRELQDEINKHL